MKYYGVDDLLSNVPKPLYSHKLTICHLNIVSLVKNIENFENFINRFSRKPDIICRSETRVNDGNINYVGLSGYTFLNNNSCTRAGGVGIYVNDSFYCHELFNLRMHLEGCEDIWIEVTLSDKSTLIIGSIYRHPLPNFHKFSQAFSNNLLKLKPKKRFVVLGDFNIDYNRYTTDTSVKLFANKITDFGCNQLITLPTRVCENRQSILDHIYHITQ